MKNNLIEVRDLEKYFEVSGGLFSRNKSIVKAVDGISFDNEKFDSIAGIILNTYKKFGYDNPNQVIENAPILKDMNKRALINSIGTVKIEVLTPNGDVYEVWQLYNAFVSKISFDKLQYNSSQILGATITLSYDWADMTYISSAGRETTY